VDSRGWSGEDVGAAAEEGFEGDGSFSDGGDVAEMRGEEELEDEEEDYAPVPDNGRDSGRNRGGGGDDEDDNNGLEEGEESHYLGKKPDERPLTGGQDWEGDNVAALVNEGEGEEREDGGGVQQHAHQDGGSGGRDTGDSDYYDEEQYREEDEEEEEEEEEDGVEYGRLYSQISLNN
jgi:hypothetical protein